MKSKDLRPVPREDSHDGPTEAESESGTEDVATDHDEL
jgi:hypothetical protein